MSNQSPCSCGAMSAIGSRTAARGCAWMRSLLQYRPAENKSSLADTLNLGFSSSDAGMVSEAQCMSNRGATTNIVTLSLMLDTIQAGTKQSTPCTGYELCATSVTKNTLASAILRKHFYCIRPRPSVPRANHDHQTQPRKNPNIALGHFGIFCWCVQRIICQLTRIQNAEASDSASMVLVEFFFSYANAGNVACMK